MTSRTVKAIACSTAGLILAITGVIAAIGGILANESAPECSVLNGDACYVQREIVTTAATAYIVGGIAFIGVAVVLFVIAAPWLRELDEAEKQSEPVE